MQKNVTISLCMYFQDAIAQTGGWKIFSESYYSLYNTYLPFISYRTVIFLMRLIKKT